MGKGSTQRPAQIPKSEFDANWDRIFGNPGTLKGDGVKTCEKCGGPMDYDGFCFRACYTIVASRVNR